MRVVIEAKNEIKLEDFLKDAIAIETKQSAKKQNSDQIMIDLCEERKFNYEINGNFLI